jgi:hypothetical protein
MSKASILKMALGEIARGVKKVDLEDIARGVKKVDLGDLTRKPNVAARVQAVKRMAGDAGKKVASKVDDWGWKGGKPGEITGLDFHKEIRKADSVGYPRTLKSIYNKAQRQVFGKGKGSHSETYRAMSQFAHMENAGIPRAYTGKIYKKMEDLLTHPNVASWISHPKYIRGLDTPSIAGMLSEQLKPLTHVQRLTAIDMLPAWSRSLDDLGETAKEITKMTNDQRETFLSLLPEWSGSLDELADAARKL